MDWKEQGFILVSELIVGYLFGRFSIPIFRKIKTGKLDFYIGDRFAQDGSEPKFGGVTIFMTVVLGITVGVVCNNFYAAREMAAKIDLRVVLDGVMLLAVLLGIGLYQDYLKETKRGIGMKSLYMIIGEFASCFLFLVLLKMFGTGQTGILLPFRMGYLDLKLMYYPIGALIMTLVINAVKVHDCFGGDTKGGVDGLCAFTTFIAALGFLSGSSAMVNRSSLSGGLDALFAVCTAGACAAFLLWGIHPAKLYLGESGSLLLGGLICIITEFSKTQFVLVIIGTAYFIDGICALLHRIIFSLKKKLLLKDCTLHGHLKKIGWGDYKIILVSGIISVLGAAVSMAFFRYADKFIF